MLYCYRVKLGTGAEWPQRPAGTLTLHFETNLKSPFDRRCGMRRAIAGTAGNTGSARLHDSRMQIHRADRGYDFEKLSLYPNKEAI